MCGISGQVALSDAAVVRADAVAAMLQRMRHRGPDGEGLFVEPRRRVALGMRRLAIIDLVTGQQPMFSEDGSVVCVFNGEIYNFGELRPELEGKGHRFKSDSDTEVIVHLYEEEGLASFARLRGMFAIAIWDARTEMAILARDRLGKKPLYFAEVNGCLSFASEISALYDLPNLPRVVDVTALDLYLTYSHVPAPHSIYRSIRKLPPGHVMTVSRGAVESHSYWRLETGPPWDAGRDELMATLRNKVQEAVRIRMVSDVPLGCFLSGGVDSSVVAACMATESLKPVKTFSIGFSHQKFNELAYARVVAESLGTEHHEFVVEPHAIEVISDIARHFGEPFGDSSALPTWYLSELAATHVTVALNGDGGDELFGGYPWYHTASRLSRLARGVPSPIVSLIAHAPGRPLARWRRFAQRLTLSPGRRFASLRALLQPALRTKMYSETLLQALDQDAENYIERHYDARDCDDIARMQYTDLVTYLPDDLLVKVDRMTMAHSLEGRSPLLDQELLEFAIRLPPWLKVDRGEGKIILRAAMRDRFPSGFLDRSKMGFDVPVGAWLRGELRDLVRRKVCAGPLMEQGWFKREAVTEMFDEHVSGRRDWNIQIWNLLMLAQWTEIFGA